MISNGVTLVPQVLRNKAKETIKGDRMPSFLLLALCGTRLYNFDERSNIMSSLDYTRTLIHFN